MNIWNYVSSQQHLMTFKWPTTKGMIVNAMHGTI